MPFESVSSLPPPHGSGQARRLVGQQLLWLTVGVIVVSAGVLAWALVVLHTQALEAGQRIGESFARVIEEQTSRTLQSVDQSLQLAALSVDGLQGRGALTADAARAALRDPIKDQPYVRALRILDTQGRIRYDSNADTVATDLSDRPFFKGYQDQPIDGLYVGEPLRSRTTGEWIIHLARRLNSADGTQHGMVVASLELTYFDTLWRNVQLGPGTSVSLLSQNGRLLMRSPLDTSLVGKEYVNNPLFTRLLPQAPSGSFEAESAVDGVTRLFAYHSLSTPPGLVVVVGQARDQVLGTWRTFAMVGMAVWGGASVAIAFLSFLLGRTARQRQRAQEGQTRMFERITDAFIALDDQAQCVYANHHAADMLRVAMPALVGHRIWQAFSVEAPCELRAACERALTDQRAAQVQEFYPALGRWLESRIYPSAHGVTVYFQDVTARKRTEAALQTSELRYRQLFDDNPQPMWVVALDGLRFLAVNQACLATYGYTRAEFLSMTLRDIRPNEDVPELLSHLAQRATGLNRHGLWRHRRKDGSPMLVDITSHSLDWDYQPALLVLATDVTARQAAQEALLLSDRALNAVTQSVIITGTDRCITSVNDAFVTNTGYGRDETIGQNCRFLQGALTDPHTVLAMRSALDAGENFLGEILNYRKDGQAFWSELSIAPVHDTRGQLSHFVGIARNISERKQVELTLQQLSRRVLEAQETERRRVARELHDELGQSLTAMKINLQSQAMFRDHHPTELERENIRIVEDAIQQVRRLAMALRPSVLDDLGLIPALRWMIEQSAPRRGLAVALDTSLEDVRFSPDLETTCFRVAQEALTNIARHAHARHVMIGLYRADTLLEMRIQDDGSGFDVAGMRQRAVLGASMGMLGMQERATLVGGTLDIRSSPGQGCTITLRCPWQLTQEVA